MKAKRKTKKRKNAQATRLALDIGTEYTKALVVSVHEKPTLLGLGRARQTAGDMRDGAVARIAGVATCCAQAIEDAYASSGYKPIEVVLGLAGEYVQGTVTELQITRRRPKRRIRESEFRSMCMRIDEKAKLKAQNELERHTGLQNIQIHLIHRSFIDIDIDGYSVKSPLQFQGSYIKLRAFHIFTPYVHYGALRTIAQQLGLVFTAAYAEPFVVASAAQRTGRFASNGLFIDIGGGSTDVALLQNGVVTATRSVPIGGKAFTQSLADHFNVPWEQAETLKLDYASGMLDETVNTEIQRVLAVDLQYLCDALNICFADISNGAPLPTNIFLYGGGAGLPKLKSTIASTPRLKDHFSSGRTVQWLRPEDIGLLADPHFALTALADVTPKCLAAHGESELGYPDALPIQRAHS